MLFPRKLSRNVLIIVLALLSIGIITAGYSYYKNYEKPTGYRLNNSSRQSQTSRSEKSFNGGRNGWGMLRSIIKMPRMDGLEVLSTIRSDPALKMLPVVILTSSRKEKDLLKIYELGANAYLVKPVDFVKFIDAIRQLGVFLGDNQRETSGNRGIQ